MRRNKPKAWLERSLEQIPLTRKPRKFSQEYVLQGEHIQYRIRPRDEKHPALLPVGEVAEFRITKDKLVLRVPEGDGKEREYAVVSMTQHNDDSKAPATVRAGN
jgi:hypothetical protein